MSAPLQHLFVYLLVAGCAGYSLWRLMPLKLKALIAVAAVQQQWMPPMFRTRLERLAGATASGCGSGCGGCGPKATPADQPAGEHKVMWSGKGGPRP
ncbi:MAG: hypothetical protein H7332_14180 [Bdellovibrionales bacterium]|nr:hypothetical protein [Ramlibacter sp.]